MEINAFKVFLAVVDFGSFSKAAENLGYTPAGVSYIINSLEKELDMKLIERNYSGIVLNSNGMALLQDIRRIVDSYDNFESNVKTRKAKRYKTLHIATIDTMSIIWLPNAVIAFQEKYPDINIEITTGDPFEINAWLAEGISDIGLTERTWVPTKYNWNTLACDPYLAVLPPNTEVPNPCPIDFFKGRDFFIPDYRRDHNISILLTKYGVKTNDMYDSTCTQTIIHNIALGRGSSILSALALDLYSGNLTKEKNSPMVIPLTPYFYRELGISMKHELAENNIMKEFVHYLKNAVKQNCIQNKYFNYHYLKNE